GASLFGCRSESNEIAETAAKVDGDAIRFSQSNVPDTVKAVEVCAAGDTTLKMSGRVVWDEDRTVRVYSPFNGRVVRIAARLGDRVTTGQPLATVDSPDYGTAQADYRKASAARKVATANLHRAEDLHQHGVISEKELQQAQSDAVSADAEAERATHVLKQFGDPGESVDQRMILRSPIDGVIVERSINPGQELRVDQTGAPLFVVTNPGFVWLALDASEEDLSVLKSGDTFSFYARANANETFSGVVLRVADYVDPVSRTIKVLGKADNRQRRLKGEMFVTAVFSAAHGSNPQVPAAAVYLLGEQHYAFVQQGETFVRREIHVGAERDGQIPVIDGLKIGEHVVSQGALFLQQMLQSRSRS
ncbi:MAG TPA: efflux RND transporter periplasmic adaptor subunit, partial [Steroidobacteraceae bacterium]|nr:efflux RND transporter periplasmic adaptor subunit [Steroidobacteraceae bacterium]